MLINLNLYSILLEIYILICGSFLLIFSVIFSTHKSYGYLIINKNIHKLFLQVVGLGLILVYNQMPIYLITWNNFLVLNSLSLYGKITIMILIISWYCIIVESTIVEKVYNFEYWILILLNILSLLILLQVNDLLITYLAVEFQSLILYVLASLKRNSEFSTEAGIKYFILGAFSSTFLLFGFSLLYSITGLTNFIGLYYFFLNIFDSLDNYLLSVIFLSTNFILISIFFKLSVAPFHLWAPDVYEGSTIAVTTFFALLTKLPLFCLLLKLLITVFYDLNIFWNLFILFCIISSIVIGTFLAFSQYKWKRFVVYSSINHVSFLLIPVLVNNFDYITYLFIYLFIYLVMSTGFFAFFGNCYYLKFPFFHQVRFLNTINLITILNPALSLSFLVIVFSMAGLPPLAGFFAKFFILVSLIKNDFFFTTLIILIFSCLSSFYYIQLIRNVYFSFQIPKLFKFYQNITKLSTFVLGICSILLIACAFNLDFLFLIANIFAKSFI